MGLGSTAKKIQTLSDSAEKMYKQVQDLQKRIVRLEATVDETHETVTAQEHELAEQRALLEAIAEAQGIDVESVVADVVIEEAEEPDGDDGDGAESGSDASGEAAAGEQRAVSDSAE